MLAYDDSGAGDAIVFLHGLAASRAIWRRTRGRLDGWRIIAVDVPGFGDSPGAGRGFKLSEVGAAVLDGLPDDVGRVRLVGHSMGGAVALAAAAQSPDRVVSLVLCASAGLLPAPVPGWAVRPVGSAWDRAVQIRTRFGALAVSPIGRRLLLGTSTAPGDTLSEVEVRSIVHASASATRTAAALQAVAAADLRAELAALPVPVGFIWGAGDLVVPRRALRAGLAVRPDAAVEVIAQAGHLAMAERPGEFAAALRRILAKLG